MLFSESDWSSGFCQDFPPAAHRNQRVLRCYLILPLLTASTGAQPQQDSISKQHGKYLFVQLSSGKCNGTDQHRQWHYLVAGLECPREGVRWLRGGKLSLSNEPSPKSQPGQCWKEARDQLGLCNRDFRPTRHRKLFLWLTWGSSCYEARGWRVETQFLQVM